MKGKKVAEVAKRQKGVAKTKRSLAYCISLGQFCMTAETLRALGYRKFSTPFDWCFTNAEMVISRLADNFDQFLDPKLIDPLMAHANDVANIRAGKFGDVDEEILRE
eukprot:GEMP01125306.1.p1 GENE.GEMP01125306.1~~GEMP01125306.1.p1  ORF type:complete len:118 (+),score=31.24 GEMP01125306.1:36-356(+)